MIMGALHSIIFLQHVLALFCGIEQYLEVQISFWNTYLLWRIGSSHPAPATGCMLHTKLVCMHPPVFLLSRNCRWEITPSDGLWV
jgi:hypothetical protein